MRWSRRSSQLLADEHGSQRLRRLDRRLFGEEMPAPQRLSADITGPFPPERERARLSLIPGVERPIRTPQHEQGTADAALGCGISVVMRSVESRSSTILLTDRPGVSRIAQPLDIFTAYVRRCLTQPWAPCIEGVVYDRVGILDENLFGQHWCQRADRRSVVRFRSAATRKSFPLADPTEALPRRLRESERRTKLPLGSESQSHLPRLHRRF
jgi:hypothetical protein